MDRSGYVNVKCSCGAYVYRRGIPPTVAEVLCRHFILDHLSCGHRIVRPADYEKYIKAKEKENERPMDDPGRSPGADIPVGGTADVDPDRHTDVPVPEMRPGHPHPG
jgi:hypothetical protein